MFKKKYSYFKETILNLNNRFIPRHKCKDLEKVVAECKEGGVEEELGYEVTHICGGVSMNNHNVFCFMKSILLMVQRMMMFVISQYDLQDHVVEKTR